MINSNHLCWNEQPDDMLECVSNWIGQIQAAPEKKKKKKEKPAQSQCGRVINQTRPFLKEINLMQPAQQRLHKQERSVSIWFCSVCSYRTSD